MAIASADIAGHATLTAGRWPAAPNSAASSSNAANSAAPSSAASSSAAPSSAASNSAAPNSNPNTQSTAKSSGTPAPVEIALPDAFAGAHHLRPGATLTLAPPAQLTDPGAARTVTVVGTYHPDSTAFWQALPPAALPQTALRPAQVLAVDPAALAFPDGLGQAGTVTWIVDPHLDGLSPDRLASLATRADDAIVHQDARALAGAAPISPPVIVSSALPAQRVVARRATLAGQAELAVPVGVLILLAGTAMVRAARTVAARRRADLALARGRGAGPAKLLAAAGLEWLALAVPLLAVVPVLAPLGARLLGAATHVRGLVHPSATALAVLITALVAVVQAALAVAATWTDAVERAPGSALRRRGARVARFQRAGTDLVLAAVAAWGLIQLHQYRSPLASRISSRTSSGASSSSAGGADSLDPVLIVVPALVAGALAILAMRLLPLLTRPLDRQARRRRGMTGAFGMWQVSRRTSRLTGALLLMVMAISVGALALTATAMRTHNADDQAAFGVGADVRVDSGSLPPAGRRAAYISARSHRRDAAVVDTGDHRRREPDRDHADRGGSAQRRDGHGLRPRHREPGCAHGAHTPRRRPARRPAAARPTGPAHGRDDDCRHGWRVAVRVKVRTHSG
ncbi:hypothetical protein ACFQ9X_11915 [Catenulispora yoronensis]